MRSRIKSKSKRPRSIFLVICEGETEKEYVELLKRHYRLPIVIKTKVSGNQINSRLLNEYIRELGLSKGDDFKLFFIYDNDIVEVVDKLRRLDGVLILSNPCVELWFYLHHANHTKEVNSKEMVRILKNSNLVWSNYVKGDLTTSQSQHLLNNMQEASFRANSLNWPANPSSNFNDFIRLLDESKKC